MAARLFEPRMRESAVMLYAWCRHCDDVVDGQALGHGGEAEPDRATASSRLARLEEETCAALAGEAVVEPPFAALREVARRHAIPSRYPLQHLAGYRMDVEGRKYGTLADTLDYAYGVAGVVGIMMAQIMGVRDTATLDRASDLGLAFQLTNMARDLVPDANVGRVYAPADWLSEAGLPTHAVADPGNRARLAEVAARLVDAAEPYYASASVGIAALPPRAAWAIATARGIYRQIGLEVKARGERAWDRRVSTSLADKVQHLATGGWTAMRVGPPVIPPGRTGLYARPL